MDVDQRAGGIEWFERHVGLWPRPVCTGDAVVVQLGEVDASGDEVFCGQVVVDASIELIAATVRGNKELNILNVCYAIEATAVRGGGEDSQLGCSAGRERADVEASVNHRAGWLGSGVRIRRSGWRGVWTEPAAVGRNDGLDARENRRIGEDLGGDAARTIVDDRGAIARGFDIRGGVVIVVRQREPLVRGEEEELVFDDWAAKRGCIAALFIGDFNRFGTGRRAAKTVECVQTGFVVEKEERTMQVVGSALGDDLDLGAGVATVGGVVRGRDDGDLTDCFFIGSNDGGTAMRERIRC